VLLRTASQGRLARRNDDRRRNGSHSSCRLARCRHHHRVLGGRRGRKRMELRWGGRSSSWNGGLMDWGWRWTRHTALLVLLTAVGHRHRALLLRGHRLVELDHGESLLDVVEQPTLLWLGSRGSC
jgi:hypothetical protein